MIAPPLTTRRVTDFVWRDGRRWNPATDGPLGLQELAGLWGQFGLHLHDPAGVHLLARDRLGVNKLFFAIGDGGEPVSSNYLVDLLRRGHQLDDIWSVPSGHAVLLEPASRQHRLYRHSTVACGEDEDAGPPSGDRAEALVSRIRRTLAATFERLAGALRGRRVFVTLSGGLDSTVVARLAREYLGAVTALTFTLEGADGERIGSDDLRAARYVAGSLGLPLEVVSATGDELAELLDLVLLHGQDWRDFNVHCGLVNAVLGRNLRERLGADRADQPAPVLLTGDTMNELMADYSPVSYRGVEYYGLPRVGGAALRRFLIAGLDSGDREVGVFNAFGLDTIQPYALAAETFAAVPWSWLEAPQAKQELVRRVMGDRVPEAIYQRTKTRAQVGGAGAAGSTLAAIVDRGCDGARLRSRFAELLGVDELQLRRLIRGGHYRFSAQAPWEQRS